MTLRRPPPVPATAKSLAAFLKEISRRKPSLAAHLAATRRHPFSEGSLSIFVPPGDLLDKALKRSSNSAVVDDAVVRVWGEGTRWTARPAPPEERVAAVVVERSDHEGDRRPATAGWPRSRRAGCPRAVQGRVETVEARRHPGGVDEQHSPLMKQAQQMQERLQRELGEIMVETSVGGGMVTVKMSGHKQLVAVKIDPEVIDPRTRPCSRI